MYENRNHAADSVIGCRLREIRSTHPDDPYLIARLLMDEGFDLQADGSGWVRIRHQREEYFCPLGVTTLPGGLP